MAYTVLNGKLVRIPKQGKYKGHQRLQQVVREDATPKDKGQWAGACNRSACLKRPATWYNAGSLAYYCRECGPMLNRANNVVLCRDATVRYAEYRGLDVPVEVGNRAEVMPSGRVGILQAKFNEGGWRFLPIQDFRLEPLPKEYRNFTQPLQE
jgi:hypothetical protein